MKYIYILTFLFLVGCGTTNLTYDKVATPGLAAALEASNTYNALSIAADVEYGGVIYKDRVGNYGYTVYKGRKREGTISFSLKIPEETILVAFWHTHAGPGDLKKYYSPEDSGTVKKYGVPFYMSDYTGRLWILPVKHVKTSRTRGVHVGELDQ